VRRDDDDDKLVSKRLETYKRHIQSILAAFKVENVDATQPADRVKDSVLDILDKLEWTTPDLPYFGSVAFSGPFDVMQAKRAGFYSPENPPEIGDRVVSFRRGRDWQRNGVVADVKEQVSKGWMIFKQEAKGLRAGVEGLVVTVKTDEGPEYRSWSAFLAPVNDMEYSSLCTSTDFANSKFAELYLCSRGLADADPISREEARASVKAWLEGLVDADEEELEVKAERIEALLAAFDEKAEASLFLYTSHQSLGPRTSLNPGQDYSIYYKALNNTLNSDSEDNLQRAMLMIKRMIYLLLYTETGEKRIHEGGQVWKGDIQCPVPLNMNKLREACLLKKVIRFRQFQSTTTDEKMATKYQRREDGRGYKWSITIPPGFWGARDIKDIAWRSGEAETLFPPYSAFRVESVEDDCCHLAAVDRSAALSKHADRHGLHGTAVELIDY
jgi:hypothetical protein